MPDLNPAVQLEFVSLTASDSSLQIGRILKGERCDVFCICVQGNNVVAMKMVSRMKLVSMIVAFFDLIPHQGGSSHELLHADVVLIDRS